MGMKALDAMMYELPLCPLVLFEDFCLLVGFGMVNICE